MRRVFSKLSWLMFVVACLSGCNGDLSNLELDFTQPKLKGVPKRLALGATAGATIRT